MVPAVEYTLFSKSAFVPIYNRVLNLHSCKTLIPGTKQGIDNLHECQRTAMIHP
jgi:hypothetical protein